MNDGSSGRATVPAGRYRYVGDRWTDPKLAGMICDPVRVSRTWSSEAARRRKGWTKQVQVCIKGRNGNQLVVTADGRRHVVLGRRLRVINKER